MFIFLEFTISPALKIIRNHFKVDIIMFLSISMGEISCNIDFKYVYYNVIRTCLMPVVVLSLVITSCQNTAYSNPHKIYNNS